MSLNVTINIKKDDRSENALENNGILFKIGSNALFLSLVSLSPSVSVFIYLFLSLSLSLCVCLCLFLSLNDNVCKSPYHWTLIILRAELEKSAKEMQIADVTPKTLLRVKQFDGKITVFSNNGEVSLPNSSTTSSCKSKSVG